MKLTIAAAVVFAMLATACSKPASAPQPEASSAAPDAASASVAAASPSDPKAFLAALYARYNDAKTDFSPFDTPEKYFDPQLLALMDAADKGTSDDDAGPLDGDPVCDCQDYRKLRADITVKSIEGDTAVLVVNLRDQGVKKAKVLTYQLAQRAGRWRIHDISNPDMPSLRRLLINSSPKA